MSALEKIRDLHASVKATLLRPLSSNAREAFGGLACGLEYAAKAIEDDWSAPIHSPHEPSGDIPLAEVKAGRIGPWERGK